jgi:phenylacetic acid degradation operon negative regulatory protein
MTDVPNVLNTSPARPDDPRLLLSEPFRAVHFVFGLVLPEANALSGRAVVGALAAIGFSDEAARGTLLRLRRGGFVESRRIGREAVYTLTPRSVALVEEMARRSADPAPPWDGAFETLVARIPASARAFREQLRRHAAYAGFGTPLPGLLIAPYAASTRHLAPLLSSAPAGVEVIRGRLAVAPEQAAPLAAAAWRLGPEATALRSEAARMASAAEAALARPPVGPAALAALWRSIGPFFELLSERPPLPAALLPPDWPLDEARTAFGQLAMAVAGEARAFVDALSVPTRGTSRPR